MPRGRAPTSSPASTLPKGRFRVCYVDGWLEEDWLNDSLTEECYLEVLADGSGSFDLGMVQGSFKVQRGLRAEWLGGPGTEPMVGTIEFSPGVDDGGYILATIKVRGEDPWSVEAVAVG